MSVSTKDFFDGLNVDSKYFTRQFLNIGVKNRFFFDRDDLEIIINNLPVTRYRSALVVQHAKKLLEKISHVAKV